MADAMERPRIEPLLDEKLENDLTPKFEAILRDVFARFDKDGDGEWSTEELQAFATETNDGEEFDEESIEEIRDSFEHNPKTSYLLPSGFIQLYSVQTQVDETETRKDLTAWGYSFALEQVGGEEAERERERYPDVFPRRTDEEQLEQAEEEEDPEDTEEDPLGKAQ